MPPPGPPPLKPRPASGPPSRPPARKQANARAPGLDGNKDALKAALAAFGSSDSDEDGPGDGSEGEWLFKTDDVVKGPVAASVIVEGIENGDLTASTPVGREMGQWIPLSDVEHFQNALSATVERQEAEAALVRARVQQRRLVAARIALMAAIVLVPSVSGAMAGYGVMKARPWDTTLDYLDRHPPLVDLPPRPKKAPPPQAVPPPPASDERAKADESDVDGSEGREDSKVASADDAKRSGKARRGGKSRREKASKRGSKDKDAKGKTKSADGTKVADAGKRRSLNQKQIMGGLKKGYSGFKRCIGKEMKRNPDMPSRITISFSVANNGKAINFKLLERQVRKGPLASCMSGVVEKLTWPTFYGERKYVEFPLNISKNK